MSLNVLAVCGSLRQKSTNKGLMRYALANAPQDMQIVVADLSEVPFYNADITVKPATVVTLLQQFAAADALLLVCPEYNYSMAPALKNALDWASREPDNALLSGKPAAAHLHLARTIVRRAERLMTELAESEAVNPLAITYINRLSDHLFVLARVLNDNGKGDVLWRPGANR